MSSDTGKKVVAAALAAASPLDAPSRARRSGSAEPRERVAEWHDPVPGDERDGHGPGSWDPDQLGLPPGCPVEPLGVDGNAFYFLDTLGQLKCIASRDWSQNSINALFMGRHHYLYWAWPMLNKKGQVTGWQAHKAREILMAACARRGPWNAVEKVRGRGAWLDADGRLLLHVGDGLVAGATVIGPGAVGGFVYPTRPPLPRPISVSVTTVDNPAIALLEGFRTWNWVRPKVDPVLLLGWIGAAFLGGALPWRPSCFITGDKGTGKSTLQAWIKAILGGWLVQAVDTTAAGVYQRVREDAVAVAIDEMEAEADPRKSKAVLKLARIAASGGLMLRGGDSHEGVEFKARSCFVFSSINAPPLEPQDLSRMALLRLHRLDRAQRMPSIDDRTLADCGRIILRRLVDAWPSFPAKYAAHREMLSEAGHDARGQDTFGTLLACAEMIVGDDFEACDVPFGESLGDWCRWLQASTMPELADALDNWRLCLNHLLSMPVEAWRGGSRQTAGQVLGELWAGDLSTEEARKLLGQAGLGLRNPSLVPKDHWLVVPNQNPMTRRLFQGSKWAGDEGAGVWSNALRQAPTSLWTDAQCKVNGVKSRATTIRLDALYGPGGMMDESATSDQSET